MKAFPGFFSVLALGLIGIAVLVHYGLSPTLPPPPLTPEQIQSQKRADEAAAAKKASRTAELSHAIDIAKDESYIMRIEDGPFARVMVDRNFYTLSFDNKEILAKVIAEYELNTKGDFHLVDFYDGYSGKHIGQFPDVRFHLEMD